MKILANDGISPSGIKALEASGFTVVTDKVDQENLSDAINSENYVGVLVRSATTVRKEVIDACPGLKLIGRGGVGMDNIDVDYARDKGLHVINTPAASSQSVAEMVFAHIFNVMRSVHDSNKRMHSEGLANFKVLKKKYGKGAELKGKTLGIIGYGRIGQAVAAFGLGLGMKVIVSERDMDKIANATVHIEGHGNITVSLPKMSKEELLKSCDIVTVHVPAQADGNPVIGATELAMIKNTGVVINTSRGGIIDEDALLAALDNNELAGAGLDVFVGEPTPRQDVLANDKISLTPHIGAATGEAQDRIGTELAEKIADLLK